jgi:hypothetical protein
MQIQKQFDKILYYSIIPDSKRQQTTTVDYKRLINGFFLTGFASLQRENKHELLWMHKTTRLSKLQWELPKRM